MKRSRLLVLVVILAAAAALWLRARRAGDGVAVELSPVERRTTLRSYVTASGEIVPVRYADVGSSVMGKVMRLPVAEGQTVRQGDLLAEIDAVPARSELEAAESLVRALGSDVAAAEARAQEARLALARAQELADQRLLPLAELDAARAAAESAEAQLAATQRRVAQASAQANRARDLVAKTEIRSPLAGVVTRLRVRQGEMVVIGIQNQPGTILMTVSDLSAIDAEVKVAEADVLRLETGQSAEVLLEALPGRRFAGRVVEIGASALPIVGTTAAAREFRVLVRLDAPDPALRPGLTCDVEILAAERQDVLTLPLQAVVLRPGDGGRDRTGVFVTESGRARFREVETGIIGGLDVEITGLSEGTRVVSGPYQVLRSLQDGQAVRTPPAG
jgi:HlyD family secretion protein